MIEIVAIYLVAGVLAGMVSGLFGVGGGFTLVPALVIALTLQAMPDIHIMHLSIGTALAVMVLTALYTAFLRHRAGELVRILVLRLLPFIVGGALAGSLIGDALPGSDLKATFIALTHFWSPDMAARAAYWAMLQGLDVL